MTARLLGSLVLCLLPVAACEPRPEPARSARTPSGVAPDTAPTASVNAPTQPPNPANTPAGVRLESSMGVQIAVPTAWSVNDYGCNMGDSPTVVRGQGAQNGCFTPEKANKELAWIGGADAMPLEAAPALPTRAITLEGTAAERAEGRTSDGRHVGWVRIPARQVAVVVKTLSAETLAAILDSVRLVSVDHHGCPERRPEAKRPSSTHPSAASRLVPEAARAIAVCYYGAHTDRLQSSTRLTGDAARSVAELLNRLPPGANPDASPRECLHPPVPPPADVLLLADDSVGRTTVYVAFSGCTGRGLDNGTRRARVSTSLLAALLRPLHTGYGHSGDLDP